MEPESRARDTPGFIHTWKNPHEQEPPASQRAPGETEAAHTYLGRLGSRLRENTLLSKGPSLWRFVMASLSKLTQQKKIFKLFLSFHLWDLEHTMGPKST